MSRGRDAAKALYINQGRDFAALEERLRGRVATVASLSGGMVEIKETGADAGAGEYLARTPGVKLSATDPVVVINVGGRRFVLPMQTSAPTLTTLEAPLALTSLARGGATDGQLLTWDAASGQWMPKAAAAAGFTASPDFAMTTATDAAVTASTTATSTYQDALTLSVPLPTGTWTMTASGSLLLKHSAGSNANLRLLVDGASDNSRLIPTISTAYTRGVDDMTATGVAGGRTVAVTLQYKGSAAGTTSASNPEIWVDCKRTA